MPDIQENDRFVKSCDEAAWFPRNLVYHDSYDYNLKAYVGRLNERESQLFCRSENANVDFWDYDVKLRSIIPIHCVRMATDQLAEFNGACVHNINELKEHIIGEAIFSNTDPRCRYM